jgi:hypothetical protein
VSFGSGPHQVSVNQFGHIRELVEHRAHSAKLFGVLVVDWGWHQGLLLGYLLAHRGSAFSVVFANSARKELPGPIYFHAPQR